MLHILSFDNDKLQAVACVQFSVRKYCGDKDSEKEKNGELLVDNYSPESLRLLPCKLYLYIIDSGSQVLCCRKWQFMNHDALLCLPPGYWSQCTEKLLPNYTLIVYQNRGEQIVVESIDLSRA